MFLGCPLHALEENISGTPLSPVVLGEQMTSEVKDQSHCDFTKHALGHSSIINRLIITQLNTNVLKDKMMK